MAFSDFHFDWLQKGIQSPVVLRRTILFPVMVVLGCFGNCPYVRAEILYSGIRDVGIPITGTFIHGVFLNVVTHNYAHVAWATHDISVGGNTGLIFSSPNDSQHGFVRSGGLENFLVDNLALGDEVGPEEMHFGNGGPEVSGSAAFVLNSENFIGFRFLNERNGLVNYGWARIALGPSFTHTSRRIVDYAYDSSGASIRVGAIPEPSSFSLVASSLLMFFRRRK